MQADTILQGDGASEELLASGNHHTSATLLGAEVDGLLNGFLVLGSCVGRLSPVLGNQVILVSELWYADALFNLLVLSLVPALCS